MAKELECPICGGTVKPSGFNGNWFCWGKCYTYGLVPKYIERIQELEAAQLRVNSDSARPCPFCDGEGMHPNTVFTCKKCAGSGKAQKPTEQDTRTFFLCHIEGILDDVGVATYFATRFEDFDDRGIRLNSAPLGSGETELDAIVNLCEDIQQTLCE